MYQKLCVTAALALVLLHTATAQVNNPYRPMPVWADKPALHKLPDLYKDASAVYLLDNRVFQYKIENKSLVQYNHVYRLVKVLDDKGIEMFNRVYIPVYPNTLVTNLKARVITSAGKIMEVPENKIKEEVEDGRRYKLFAMEGIDKGSEVEYSYTLKKDPSFFGSEIFQNQSVPYLLAKMAVITPAHVQFTAKGFNGFKVLPDSLINEERILPAFSENITELSDEKYALRDKYLQRGEYKLSYNLSTASDVEMYTWKELCRKVYPNLTSIGEKEKKALVKYVAGIKIPAGASEEKTVQLLEDYMKSSINVDDKLVSENADNIEAIIKTGNANDFGANRLLVALLEHFNVKYQVVFPSVRNQLPLDEDLANWNRIDETLIYFPGTGKFVQPAGEIYRYPYVTPYWCGTRGLFLRGTDIGGVRTAIGRFDTIPMEPFSESAHNMEVSAKLDATGDSLIIDCKQILKGYAATSYRPIWKYLPKDKQDEAVKGIINNIAKSDNIKNIKTEHTLLTDAWDNKPLVISSTIHTAEPLEKAGKKILFKIGDLIGPQEQMYQEKQRQMPVELDYPHILYRKLKFEIPEGYSIKNPGDLKLDIQHTDNDGVSMGFVSSYSIKGNILDVDVMETYRDQRYPLSQFETFKKVINAAADFNKVVLVLEKIN
ncbi:MAG TPA: DUF3857 domain-containing protein [Ferruginibacter sp.]|nr:DUF3857 domain-containing protein [Ferruginibacter sp.]